MSEQFRQRIVHRKHELYSRGCTQGGVFAQREEGPMVTATYWVAACEHINCDWEMVTGSEDGAEEAKRDHEAEHPDHPVDVLASDQMQYWLIPPMEAAASAHRDGAAGVEEA